MHLGAQTNKKQKTFNKITGIFKMLITCFQENRILSHQENTNFFQNFLLLQRWLLMMISLCSCSHRGSLIINIIKKCLSLRFYDFVQMAWWRQTSARNWSEKPLFPISTATTLHCQGKKRNSLNTASSISTKLSSSMAKWEPNTRRRLWNLFV